MEPHNFLENLKGKEIYNTLRMPIEQNSNSKKLSQKEVQGDNNKIEINNNNNDVHFIKSTEFRLPSFLKDISYDKAKNK